MTPDLKALRVAAERATESPWVAVLEDAGRQEVATVACVGDYIVGVPTPGFPGGDYRNIDCQAPDGEFDAQFMALANPKMVTWLLDRERRLRALERAGNGYSTFVVISRQADEIERTIDNGDHNA